MSWRTRRARSPPSRIPVREVAVLVREYRTKCALPEVAQEADAEDENPTSLVTGAIAHASSLVDGHVRSRSDANLVDGTRADSRGDFTSQSPQSRCLRFAQFTTGISRIDAYEERLHHLEHGDDRCDGDEQDQLHGHASNQQEQVNERGRSTDDEHSDERKRNVVVPSRDSNQLSIHLSERVLRCRRRCIGIRLLDWRHRGA